MECDANGMSHTGKLSRAPDRVDFWPTGGRKLGLRIRHFRDRTHASPSTRGYPKGIFHSPSEATTAALLAAQTIIDSRAKAGKVVKSLAR